MKILLAVDGSAHSNAAIQAVLERNDGGKSQLLVAAVADNVSGFLGKLTAKQAQGFLDAAGAALSTKYESNQLTFRLMHGKAAQSILAEVRAWEPDLIALGAHGHHGIGRIILGSVTDAVVKGAPCSVLVARKSADDFTGSPQNILVCLEDVASREILVDWAARQEWPNDARLTIVHVFTPPVKDYSPNPQTDLKIFHEVEGQTFRDCQSLVDEAASRMRADIAGVSVSTRVFETQDVQTALINVSKELQAGLIIVGPRHTFGLERALLGSVSEHVLLHASCSVQILHSPRITE